MSLYGIMYVANVQLAIHSLIIHIMPEIDIQCQFQNLKFILLIMPNSKTKHLADVSISLI